MKPIHVAVLGLLALGAGIAVWFSSVAEPEVEFAQEKLFPALALNIDEVSQVSLKDAEGNNVTLNRTATGWTVKEKSKYHASAGKVGELVVAASEAAVVEQKTANPDLYERLGVRDITDPESAAVLVSLVAAGETYDVLIGNASDRFGGSTFVRKPDTDTSVLISPALSADTDRDAWLDKQILDIKSEDVQSVVVVNPDGNTELRKEARTDEAFDLVGRTDEQTLNDSAVRGLGRGLASLMFEDVKRGVAFPVNDYKRKQITYTLFSGVVINVTLFYRDVAEEESDGPPKQARYYLNANATFDEAVAQQFVPQPTATVDGSEPTTLTLTPADLVDRRAEVSQMNEKMKTWIYEITASRFESMNKRTVDLIQAPDS